MTPISLWLGAGVIALVLTLLWAVMARETNVYLTSGFSWALWGWLAIAAGDLGTVLSDDVLHVTPLQYICLSLALISLIVFMLHHFGAYPPNVGGTATNAGDTR